MRRPVSAMEFKRARSVGQRPPRPQGTRPLYGDLLGRPLSKSAVAYWCSDESTGRLTHYQGSFERTVLTGGGIERRQLPNAMPRDKKQAQVQSQPKLPVLELQTMDSFLPDFMLSPSKRLEEIHQAIHLPPEQEAVISEEVQDWYFFPTPSSAGGKSAMKQPTPSSAGGKSAMKQCDQMVPKPTSFAEPEALAAVAGSQPNLNSVPSVPSQDFQTSSKNSRPQTACQKVNSHVDVKTQPPSARDASKPTGRTPCENEKPSYRKSQTVPWGRADGGNETLEELLAKIKSQAIENPELKVTLQYLVGISAEATHVVNAHISRLREQHELCGQEERKKLADIISLLTNGKSYMNLSDFQSLHDVIKSIVAPKGFSTVGRLGSVISWNAEADFKKVDHDNGRTSQQVEVGEVLVWLHRLYEVAQKDFSRWMGKDFMYVLHDIEIRSKARSEVHKYERTRGLLLTMAQYGEAFRDLRKSTKGSMVIENEGEAEPLQPEKFTSLDELYHASEGFFEVVQEFGEELKTSVGAQFWAMGPLKDAGRAQEKIDSDYHGDFLRLIDLLRFSLICADLNMARHAIEEVRNHEHWEIVRVKSSFATHTRVGLSGGYRDVKINARHKDVGIIIEIQLHILIFYMIKQEGGHQTYEWARNFKIKGITSAEDVLGDVSTGVLSHMMEIAQVELDNAVHSKAFRKEIKKRMTLFECAALAREPKVMKHQGHKLLEYIGDSVPDPAQACHGPQPHVLRASTSSIPRINDPMMKRYVMLKLAKSSKFKISENREIDYERRVHLLEKAMNSVLQHYTDWVSTADKLFLAECKCAIAVAKPSGVNRWDANRWDAEAAGHLQEAITLYADSGLGDDHPAVARARICLGSAMVASGDHKAGIEHLRAAETSLIQHFGDMDHRTSDAFLELSNAWKTESLQPQISETEKVQALQESLHDLERCLQARMINFGEEDMRVGNVYLHMADVKEMQENDAGAKADFIKCIEIWRASGKLRKTYLHSEEEQMMYDRLLLSFGFPGNLEDFGESMKNLQVKVEPEAG